MHDIEDQHVSEDARRQRGEQLAARMAAMREQGLIKRGEVLDPLEKARANPRSLKLAIRAMCWQCEGGFADPGVRQRVGLCPNAQCPLWNHRPWQKKADGASADAGLEDEADNDSDSDDGDEAA